MQDYVADDFGKVHMVDEKARGNGRCVHHTPIQKFVDFAEGKHTPELKKNLISMG